MVLITGTIKDSAAQPLDAKLTVKLDGSIVDTTPTPHAVLVPEPYEVDIVAGALSIELPESATSNTTYHFLLEKTITTTAYYLVSDGTFWNGDTHQHTDLEYYTGKLQTEESQLLSKVDSVVRSTLMDFHAIAPNQATVEFSDLIHTGISSDVMDTSIRRLAYELTNVQEFVEAIRGGPVFKGPYDAAVYYRLNDVVSYNGSSWMWIAADPGVGQVPVEGTYWTLIAAKGDAGGTGGDDTTYNATGWNGVLDAPSKNAVRDIIETLATISQLSSYAPIASPTFTGAPAAPTPTAGSNSTAIATTAFVANEFAKKASPTFTGNVGAPTPAAASNADVVATTKWVRDNAKDIVKGASSLAANGYAYLVNGLIIQWGTTNNGTGAGSATFPIAFPTACQSVVMTAQVNNDTPRVFHLKTISTTGFTFYRGLDSGAASNISIYYIAVGY